MSHVRPRPPARHHRARRRLLRNRCAVSIRCGGGGRGSEGGIDGLCVAVGLAVCGKRGRGRVVRGEDVHRAVGYLPIDIATAVAALLLLLLLVPFGGGRLKRTGRRFVLVAFAANNLRPIRIQTGGRAHMRVVADARMCVGVGSSADAAGHRGVRRAAKHSKAAAAANVLEGRLHGTHIVADWVNLRLLVT